MQAVSAYEGGPLRVLVAEGHGLLRAGFRVLLERQADIAVVADAASTDDAVTAARATSPDVVLMDLDLPGAGGIETTRRILDALPGAGPDVVMLMTSESDDAVFGALRAGATGLLLKDTDPEQLVAAVRVVAGGEALLAPGVATRVVADFVAQPERLRCTREQLEALTAREREVVALVAYGLSNEEIAERLVVTRATAKTHVSRALCKLNVRDRAQLVVLAYEAGLVSPGPPVPAARERIGAPAQIARFGRYGPGGRVRRSALRPVAA